MEEPKKEESTYPDPKSALVSLYGYYPQRGSGINRSNLTTGSHTFNYLTGRKKLEHGPVVVVVAVENKMAFIRRDSFVLMKIPARRSQSVDL